MDALAARALLFERKLQELPVEFSISGAEALDNQLAVLEISGADTTQASKLGETADGPDQMLISAATICKSLIMRDTKQRVFSDGDVEMVAKMGLTVIKPLGELVAKVSGLGPKAVPAAVNFSPPTPASDSSSSSVESSEAETTLSGASA